MIRRALTTSLLILALPLATLARSRIMPLTTVVRPGGTHGRCVAIHSASFLVTRHANLELMTHRFPSPRPMAPRLPGPEFLSLLPWLLQELRRCISMWNHLRPQVVQSRIRVPS